MYYKIKRRKGELQMKTAQLELTVEARNLIERELMSARLKRLAGNERQSVLEALAFYVLRSTRVKLSKLPLIHTPDGTDIFCENIEIDHKTPTLLERLILEKRFPNIYSGDYEPKCVLTDAHAPTEAELEDMFRQEKNRGK
jgi:hypothetical protein